MNTLVKTFCNLVQVDSPTGTEDSFGSYLVEYLKDKVDVIKKDSYGNVYVRLNGTGDAVFFSAHLDTVEPGKGIKPQIKDEYIASDGTTILGADNKSTIACYLQLIEELKKTKDHKTIEFVFTKEEETTSAGADNFKYSLLQAKTGFCFDSVNPIGTIITASPYYERFDLKILGKAAHASKPQAAINVLTIFKEILHNTALGKLDEDTVFNIGLFNGGYVRNTVPGEMTANGEIRGFVEEKINTHKKNFETAVKNACEKYKATHELNFHQENKGYKFNPDIEIITNVIEKMTKVGINPQTLDAWAVSDANIFNHKNLICVNLGDGVEFPHSKQERIKVEDMEKNLKLMVELSL